jgi:hypothetical protein
MGSFTDALKDTFDITDVKQIIVGNFIAVFAGYVTPTTPVPLWMSIALIAGVLILMLFDVTKIGVIEHVILAVLVAAIFSIVLGILLYQTIEMIGTITVIGVIGGLAADIVFGKGDR